MSGATGTTAPTAAAADAARDAYAEAGVDIAAGDEAVRRIAAHARRTHRPGVLDMLGGFAAGVELDLARWRRPVLVTGADGVGTKLRVAALAGRWETIGQDLVAMCVNDVATTGAEPLAFLDYLATSSLDPEVVERVVSGIADGCELAGCSLVGGETAEMPGMYRPGELDLAGFCLGVVDKDERLPSADVAAGDAIVAIASSGLHSNGYSLVRRALLGDDGSRADDELRARLAAVEPALGRPLVDELLEPTRIYAAALAALRAQVPVRAIANVTGGGLVENLPRVLGDGLGARIDTGSWQRPAIFGLVIERGALAPRDAWRTLNMGVGACVVVPADRADAAVAALEAAGERAWRCGEVVAGSGVELAGGGAA